MADRNDGAPVETGSAATGERAADIRPPSGEPVGPGSVVKGDDDTLRVFFDTISDLVVVAALSGEIIFANGALRRRLGYTAAEVASMKVLDLHPPECRHEAEQVFAAILHGEKDHCPLPLAAKDGTAVPVETRVWFGRWEGAQCLFGLSRDLGAEQEAQQRFERLFRNNPNPTALSDADTRIISDVNDAFLETLGYSKGGIVGRSAADIGLFVHPEQEEAMVRRLRGEGRVSGCELQVRCGDGTLRDGIFSAERVASQGRQFFLTVMVDITGRKRAESALTVEHERLQSIITGTDAGTWEWNVQTGAMVVNDRWAEILGYRSSDIHPFSIEDLNGLTHPDDLRLSRELLGAHFRGTSGYYACEKRMHHRHGNWVWVLDRGKVASWTPDGRPLSMYGTHQDITARKRAESALQENEANFRAFFASITDLVIVATPEGRILFANRALERRLGYSAEEYARMKVLELHPAEHRREAEAVFAAMARGERGSCPLPLAAKDGTCIPVETRVWSGKWNGRACIFGICKDLSAEQEAQQRFERLFSSNPAPMAVSSVPDGLFTDVNDAFVALLGYSREEVVGRTSGECGLFVSPAQQAEAALQLQTAGCLSNVELQVRCRDGRILDGLFSGELIRSQGCTHFLTVMIDITERKQAEEALRRLNETFEQQVRDQVAANMALERTVIHQSRLAAVGEMLNNIAHQWRQPLNALGIVLSNMRDAHQCGELDDACMRQAMGDAGELIQKMSATINDFRSFFHPDREMVPFSVREQILAAVTIVDLSFRKDGIAIRVLGDNDITLFGIPNEYSQVLLNLLANARDAIMARQTARGDIEIEMAQRGADACVCVRDNGGGIPPGILDRIFEPYFSTKPQGSGIGLYMSEMIVSRRMNGRIEARNTARGAELTIIASLHAAAAGDPRKETP